MRVGVGIQLRMHVQVLDGFIKSSKLNRNVIQRQSKIQARVRRWTRLGKSETRKPKGDETMATINNQRLGIDWYTVTQNGYFSTNTETRGL